MSIKTTHIVTREFAIATIKRKKLTDKHRIKGYRLQYYSGRKLKELTDEELEDVLENAIHNGFYNFTIVSQEAFDENKNQPMSTFQGSEYFGGRPYLDDLDNLPEYNDAW